MYRINVEIKKEDLKISYGDLKQAVGDELTAFNLQQRKSNLNPQR